MIKIVADEAIPWLDKLFSSHGEIHRYSGRVLDKPVLSDADLLLIRSTVKITKDLLLGSSVKCVASATVGCDHVDQNALKELGIKFVHAPGCNANAVSEYVISALAWHEQQGKLSLDRPLNAAIIGCGRIGSIVKQKLEMFGFNVVVNDPPLQFSEKGRANDWAFVDLNQALQRDLICLHTPLTKTGKFPTYHLIDTPQLSEINPKAILINAGRGGAINNQALMKSVSHNPELNVVLDVWENEPDIVWPLLNAVNLGTAHLAGHSWRGKVMGTVMIYEQAGAFFGWHKSSMKDAEFKVPLPKLIVNSDTSLYEVISRCYDIEQETAELRSRTNNKSAQDAAQEFDSFRKNYHKRAEFSDLSCQFTDDKHVSLLQLLGFNIIP